MPVDTSLYGNIAQPNPLGQMGQMLQVQSAMNQNALFQQQFAARQALGQLAQSSVDPATGQMDWNKYSLSISTDPRTAFMAREVIESLTRQKLLDADTFGKKLDNAQKATTLIGNTLTPIAMEWAKNGAPQDAKDPSKVDTTQLVNQAGLLVGQAPEMYDQVKSFLVGLKALPRPQAQQALIDYTKFVQIAKGGLDSVAPLFRQDVGGGVQYGQTDRFTGAPQGTGFQPKTLTPAEQQDQVKTANPLTGAPQLAPRGSMPMAPSAGAPPIEPQIAGGGMSAMPAASGGAMPAESTPITGRAGSPAEPQQAAGGAMPAPSSLTSVVGPPKGVEDAQSEVLTKFAPALQERVSVANQLKLLMQQAQEETRNFKQGGGTDTYIKMAQLAQALGVKDEAVDKLANGDIASGQAANKLFMQVGSLIASQLIRAGGGRMTQTEWGKTLSEGAPNIDMDPRAISKILAAMRETVHYTNMENQAYNAKYQAYRGGQYDIGQFPSDWQQTLGSFLDSRARARGVK